MTKLVIKTAIKTLLALIIFCMVLYGIFALFIPRPLADTFYDMGNYSLGMHYYEKQYNKTESVDDLLTICDYCNEETDSNFAMKYLEILVNRKDFAEICNKLDNGKNYNISSMEYYFDKYVVAVYYGNGIEGAVSLCEGFVETNGYTAFSPYNSIISSSLVNMSANQKIVLKGSIQKTMQNLTEGTTAYSYAERDYNLVNG